MIKFLFATHRREYIELAMKYSVWPEVPYELAHGKLADGDMETDILHDLLHMGIVHRRRKHRVMQEEDDEITFS